MFCKADLCLHGSGPYILFRFYLLSNLAKVIEYWSLGPPELRHCCDSVTEFQLEGKCNYASKMKPCIFLLDSDCLFCSTEAQTILVNYKLCY